MRMIAKLGIGLCLTLGLGFASTYKGQLMDASCYKQNPSHQGEKTWVRCAPTPSTTSFAIHTMHGTRLLDNAGNDKARIALQNGQLNRDKNTDMPVVISGVRHGNTITVANIRARASNNTAH